MVLGRLTRDPEVRYTPSGTPVCDIGLATNRRIPAGDGGQWKDETTYIDVTLWRRQAEVAGQYLNKGREVFIEGYLTMDSWEDKSTGQKRSKLKVVCDNMQLIGGAGGQGGGQRQSYQNDGYNAPQQQNSGYQQAPAQQYQQATSQQSAPPAEPAFEPEEEDDIPF